MPFQEVHTMPQTDGDMVVKVANKMFCEVSNMALVKTNNARQTLTSVLFVGSYTGFN